MGQIGRNAPCPCGSGKKYKRCCLDRCTALKRQPQGPLDSLPSVIEWLKKRYHYALVSAQIKFFAGCLGMMMLRQLGSVEQNPNNAVHTCLNEWLIADAYLEMENTKVRTGELLLGPDGPVFTANEQRHIEELAASILSMYEVLEVRQGEGLLLRDLLRADEAPFFAHGVQAAETLVCWDIAGLRILRRQDTCTIAEGIYAFERATARALVRSCVTTLPQKRKHKGPPAKRREVVTLNIISCWLKRISDLEDELEEPDEQSHEPLFCTTDRYQVANWEALEKILDKRGDVEWKDDGMWTWFGAIAAQEDSDIVRLTFLPPAVLKVECCSTEDADAARKWLKKMAVPHISHLERLSVQEPLPVLQHPSLELSDNCPEHGELSPEKAQNRLDASKAAFYEHCLHTPLPNLSGNTMLQASSHPTDRARVLELLKSFEHLEATVAKNTGCKAFDLAFLWKRLGLERY